MQTPYAQNHLMGLESGSAIGITAGMEIGVGKMLS